MANPAGDKGDQARLRRQFETWAANDAPFQQLADNNKLLAEVKPVSKDLSALGEAGLRLLDYLTPPPPALAVTGKKKPKKPSKQEVATAKAVQAAKQEWLARLNADLARLSKPPARGQRGAPQSPSADVRLAAFRPVKVLADAMHP